MQLLERFQEFITEKKLFSKNQKLLLAVSGGLDSVVLCDLCYRSGFDFVIAHCNFRLRGEESDRDEQFVRQLPENYGKSMVAQVFDTSAYAAEFKLSIQVAGRQRGYNWFYEIVADWTVGFILTALHV